MRYVGVRACAHVCVAGDHAVGWVAGGAGVK